MEEVKVLWTGGWDSTFRIVELSRQNLIIQPVYVVDDDRKSKEYEIIAMNEIIEALLEKKETKAKIKQVLEIKKEEIPENEKVTNAYQKIKNKTHLGSQHDWLARLAFLYPGIEIGTELCPPKFSHIIHSIDEFGHLVFEKGIGYLDKEKSSNEGLLVLGNFRYPIIQKSEKDMLEIIKNWGYEGVMSHIWFCHRPIKKKPCGLCHPCILKIESNMDFLLSHDAIKRYKRYLHFKKIGGEKFSERLLAIYRRIIK